MMDPMNDHELIKKVHSIQHSLINSKGYVASIDVLMELGVLSKADYENWRGGRVDYLERVCKINLKKLSKINHEIRVFARQYNLKGSWTDYRTWGKGKHIRLRFSKSGREGIEHLYATHYVRQTKVATKNTVKEPKAAVEPNPTSSLNGPNLIP
jgi:hypothetical protein